MTNIVFSLALFIQIILYGVMTVICDSFCVDQYYLNFPK